MKTILELYALWLSDTNWTDYTKKQKKTAVWFGISVASVALSSMITSGLMIPALASSLISLVLSVAELLKSGIDIKE